MTLSQIAAFADLAAALGVLGSMLFLAWELRKNVEQSRRGNWQAVLSGLREHKRRTDDPNVAKIVVKGRENYEALEPWEKVTFGYYMEEMLQCYDGLLVHGGASVVSREETDRAAIQAFRYQFGFKGSRQWWEQSGLADRWPRHIVGAVEKALAMVNDDMRNRAAGSRS